MKAEAGDGTTPCAGCSAILSAGGERLLVYHGPGLRSVWVCVRCAQLTGLIAEAWPMPAPPAGGVLPDYRPAPRESQARRRWPWSRK